MSTLYWIACHVDMKILRPSMNNVHTLPRRVKYKNLSISDDPLLTSVRRRTVGSYTESASSYITVFMCKQKPYPIWLSCRRKSYLVYCRPPWQQRFFACSMLVYSRKGWFPVSRIKFTFANKIEVMRERSLASVKVEPRLISCFSSALSILPLFYLRD